MTSDEDRRDRRLLHEIGRITNEYGALHRRTARDLAHIRSELVRAHAVLGTVAHDLRAPLSAVTGFTELLLDDPELTGGQRELGERVSRAAATMTTLTEELVEAVTVGSSPLRSARVDLAEVVADVVARYQLLLPPRGVRVVLDTDATEDGRAVVHGDEAKLERVLDNLLSNALKFSRDDGIVRVSVTTDGRDAEIRVRDDGPGLPPEQLEEIFSAFHRAPGASGVPGIGLGLTIVKQITERHGGRVHVDSVLGAGSTFVVRLPLRSEAPAPAAPSPPGS